MDRTSINKVILTCKSSCFKSFIILNYAHPNNVLIHWRLQAHRDIVIPTPG